ncbi:unnamed protein product, partial [Darwinula stevensoni]
SFFPWGEGVREDVDGTWKGGILLFTSSSSRPFYIFPLVPIHRSWAGAHEAWISVEKLPQVYGERRIPSSLRRISFRGRVDVHWYYHTAPILWVLDRNMAGLPPFSQGSFFPRGEGVREDVDGTWKGGILLFTSSSSRPFYILPLVPIHRSWAGAHEAWISVEKLPQVYGERRIPSSLRRISFRGRVDVHWYYHTAPILWVLDRNMAGLPPFSQEELKLRREDRDDASGNEGHRHEKCSGDGDAMTPTKGPDND